MATSFTQMFEVSRTGIMWRMLDLDVVSNNLGNINTTGYKQQRLNFTELLNNAQSELQATTQETPTTVAEAQNLQFNGIQVLSTQMLTQQGALIDSQDPLDIAISGEGFLGFELSDGTIVYSRDGNLEMDQDGNLVNGNGYHLVWDGEIPEDAYDFSIDKAGAVYATVADEKQIIGNIQLFRFINPSGLIGYGNNMWVPSEDSGEAVAGTPGTEGFGFTVGETLESSNVDMTEEFTRMISLQRGFEMSVRALQQADSMMGQAIHVRQG